MSTLQEIEQVLRDKLPPEFHDQIPKLVSTIKYSINNTNNTKNLSNNSEQNAALRPILSALAGMQIKTDKSILTFGSGNQFGDVTFRDIAGGNISTTHAHVYLGDIILPSSPPTKPRQRRRTTSRKAKSNTLSIRSTISASNSSIVATVYDIPARFLAAIKIISFAFIGLMCGGYSSIAVTNTQYYYQTGSEITTDRVIGSIIGGFIGALIGLSFLSKRRRASGIAWWGHLIGFLIIGLISAVVLQEITIGIFWIGGVIGWFFAWLTFFGGHKEFR